ncbi:MAG: ATP-binding protein [Deltaproteobacteria bacterium]|nr:ATP-binding protein [Deltaproteobacteria bacterium]
MPLRPRIAAPRLVSVLRRAPALALLGARQVGKSTLARLAFPDFTFVDLERPVDLERAARDPEFLLSQSSRLVIDEAQRLPEIFPVLRSHLDRHPGHRIVLLGSASPGLVRKISESLTGRVALFELAGISILEHPIEPLWLRGGFPRLHWTRPRADPANWYPAYVRTTLERDIPQLGVRIAAARLRALLTMVAHAQGSVSNLSELGGSLGISYHSVAHILDVLEGVFLVRRLAPYAANLRKRLVKSPKLYVRDTGILHSLLGVGHRRQGLLSHPKAGASFETFCIEQIIQHAQLRDPSAEAFFYRTHGGTEVDLLLRLRGALLPIEIKLGLGVPDLRGLEGCMRDLGLRQGFVVNLSTESVEVRRGIRMGGLREVLGWLQLVPEG